MQQQICFDDIVAVILLHDIYASMPFVACSTDRINWFEHRSTLIWIKINVIGNKIANNYTMDFHESTHIPALLAIVFNESESEQMQ